LKEDTSGNLYAQLLKEQGNYVITVEGVDWYDYQGFMAPAYLPHCVPEISRDLARKVLHTSGKPFVRWDSRFGKVDNSEWWYILKRGAWSIDNVKNKKKRWMIRQGKKHFSVRPLSFDAVLEKCPDVARSAAARYKGPKEVETYEILKKRVDAAQNIPGVLEYLGCFHENTLASCYENYVQGNCVWLANIRHDPAFLKKYSSYGFLDGILDYYLNQRQFDYVLDGSRSIHHRTEFQEHLINVFEFTKEYSVVNIVYSNIFGVLVKTAYPFKNILERVAEKSSNKILNNIAAVLRQEYIRRACQ